MSDNKPERHRAALAAARDMDIARVLLESLHNYEPDSDEDAAADQFRIACALRARARQGKGDAE